MEKLTGFGPHLMLDLSDCDPVRLNDLDLCVDLLNRIPDEIGMTKITQPHVFRYKGMVPDDEGITGMVIIAESHISLHTFPLKRYCFVDIFSCKPFDVERGQALFIEAFRPGAAESFLAHRGRRFPRGTFLPVAAGF